MKYILSFAFLITLLVACAGTFNPGSVATCYSCHWNFIIDEKFSQHQKEQVVLALREWQENIPELNYSIYYEPLFEKYNIQERLAHIHCGYTSDMSTAGSLGTTITYTNNESTGAEIYINITPDLVQNDTDLLYTKKVMEHEIGHAFGLPHVSESIRSDVMNPVADISHEITTEDVDAFYNIHPSCKQIAQNTKDAGD